MSLQSWTNDQQSICYYKCTMNMIHNTYLIKVPVGRKICSSQFNIYCGFSYSGQLFLQHSLATWKLQRSEKSNNAFTNWFKYFDSFPTPCHILEHSILFWLLLGTHCTKCQPNWKIEPMTDLKILFEYIWSIAHQKWNN